MRKKRNRIKTKTWTITGNTSESDYAKLMQALISDQHILSAWKPRNTLLRGGDTTAKARLAESQMWGETELASVSELLTLVTAYLAMVEGVKLLFYRRYTHLLESG